MKKILVIEDEDSVRDNLLEVLEAEEFQAISANNGLTGVKLATEHQPDLIICDVMMPEMDGFTVLQVLRQAAETATIPFIFLTAKADQADLRRGMNTGADDYLIKPCTPEELLDAIAARLTKQEIVTQQLTTVSERTKELEQKMQQLQLFTEAKDNLLNNLSLELRSPLSNINMAIRLLKETPLSAQRDRYLQILQDEFNREIALLNQVTELQRFLTPENVTLLRQFNLLKDN